MYHKQDFFYELIKDAIWLFPLSLIILGLLGSLAHASIIDQTYFGKFTKEKEWTTKSGDDVRIESNKSKTWERHTIANNDCKIIIYEKR